MELDLIKNKAVFDSVLKTQSMLHRYRNIGVSVSGGSDSDILIDLFEQLRITDNVTYYFMDTGVEYEATIQHLHDLQDKYGIEIKELPALKKIPICVKSYGVPFLSKWTTEMIKRLQRHNFQWEDEPFEVLYEKYPRCKVALQWWCNKNQENNDGKPSFFDIKRNKWLKEFLMDHNPYFPIDNMCCTWSKKKTALHYEKEMGFDLVVTGVRRNEGGIRTSNYKSCFSDNSSKDVGFDEFRAIYYWKDEDKKYYKDLFTIVNSDCYEVYGLSRTGCVGCPYAKDFEGELSTMQEHEPKLYKAAICMFGKSYDYTREYYKYREKKKNGS